MHMAEGRAQGIDYRYTLIDPDAMSGPKRLLAELIDNAETAGYTGLNITHPYKTLVVDELDTLSDDARNVGAVNTVIFRDGRRIGHNTDFWGFAESLRQNLKGVRLDTVLQLGAGGAGAAVTHALRSLGVRRLLINDRSEKVADVLAAKTGAEVVTDPSAAAQADGIVNATPMGMAAHPGLAIPPDHLEPRHWVADIVYVPLETELLRIARALGCHTLDGAGMAIYQAAKAFELFCGLKADPERMRRTFDTFGAQP
ncbi:shikimate dehydrogenase [Rhodovulum imhoffii]|uniref:Shikimate dehydrogenase n=2 Tax=Rhodovulum imhoffii TaxID=365340 RepID=A0A2T5BNX1_9RHOB|nr:shikimate dehydrogenase [Rhodovulum imhoffii]